MDASIAARLSAGKQLYSDGDLLRRRADDAGRIQSAVMLDGSVELVLKTVVAHLKIAAKLKLNLPELIATVSPHVASAPAFEPHRAHRNNAQHSGIAPRSEVLDAMSADARSCLVDAFAACGVEFERFTLTDLVANATTRKHLEVARSNADTDPVGATDQARRALVWIRSMGECLIAEAYDVTKWHHYDPEEDRVYRTDTSDARAKLTHAMLGMMSVSSLGFELPEYLRFVTLADASPEYQITQGDAWWCIDYVARHAYRLERQLPQMEGMAVEDTRTTGWSAGMLPTTILRPAR